ncbi:GNAT family N-acetyltransferase [Jiangella anatolica]|uniref:GNAT family N-acetyltransferase n=1 Tax=Jiangella anatolica TaxID=2670374 RepID=A0A2W2CQC5_9ACTN|nr:GNAT family protein [Jiangella anatolica]PZF82453.1 GNAT family N-acetyltransferase [Jiangella anatolica]
MELTTARLRLRDFRDDDLDGLHALVSDDRLTRSLSFDSRDRDQATGMLRGFVTQAGEQPRVEYYLAVTLREDDDGLIGFFRLGLAGVRAGKLGYLIAAEHQGQGYATEAAAAVLDLAFGPLGLHRVTAAIGPDNAASIAVVERLGLVLEGRLRENVFTNGAWRDSLLYSVLAAEWPPPHAASAKTTTLSR